MTTKEVLDLKRLVVDGTLFRSPADGHRVEAYIPSMGHENHAASMAELPNGDLLCAWFAGTAEGTGDISIALARLPHGASRWTTPVWVSDDPTRSEQNPVLFPTPDGKLWLLYTAQETRGGNWEAWERRRAAGEVEGSYTMQWTAIIRRRISHDNGQTWGPVDTFMGKPTSFCRQPMVTLSNGDWLFPMYYSILDESAHGNDYTVMQISEDQGQTWTEYAVPRSNGRVHASVVELANGRLVAFFRSRAADRIYLSRSNDYGRTWTAPERTALPNNNASIQARKLASGNIALVFNHFSANDDPARTMWPRTRSPLTAALSEDEGATWPYMRHIDTGDDFYGSQNEHLNRRCDYPCILQTRDGTIHIGYSYRNRQCIKYVCIAEEWIRGQLDYVYGFS